MAAAATYFVFRIGLGGVCLLAGLEKVRAPRELFQGVERYRLVPRGLAPAVGGALIAAELGLGTLLVSNLAPVAAAIGAIALFGVFAAALAVSLARSNRAPCHCFGASELETISPMTLIRALALTGLAAALLALALDDPHSLSGGRIVAGLLIAAALVAGSADEARCLVRGEFAKLREGSTSAERPYRDAPDFNVDRIDLDTHKLLTNHITR